MSEPSASAAAFHDPLGPVSVVGDVDLDCVRSALGPGCWIGPGSTQAGLSLVVTTRAALAATMADRGIPAVCVGSGDAGAAPVVDPASLDAWLRAFADGAVVSGQEAEYRAWLDAVRAEEEREQQHAREVEAEAIRAAEVAEAETRAQLDRMTAHIAAMEGSTSWKVARRLSGAKGAARNLARRPGR